MNHSTDRPPPGTRELLLDAAEALFAERGIQGASVRAITRQAGANLASVHYHFGSKDNLAREVFRRRLRPINAERLRLLDEIEANPARPGPEPLLEAFLAPALRLLHGASEGGRAFARLMGRTSSHPELPLHREVFEELQPVLERFVAAFERSLPHLPRRDIVWRLYFAVGTIGHTVASARLARELSDGLCDPTDADATIRRLVAFLSAGFRAPAHESSTAEVRK